MLEPHVAAQAPGAELQAGQGIDGAEVCIGQRTDVAEHHPGASVQLVADTVTDRVDVGSGDVLADREPDRLGSLCGWAWWVIGNGQGGPPS
jgi:hypothetical protein